MGKVLEAAAELEKHNSAQERMRSVNLDMIEHYSAQRQELLFLAEQILLDRVGSIDPQRWPWSGQLRFHFSEAELSIFDQLGWSREQLGKEAGRCSGVVRWRSISGTPADRESAKLAATEAEAALSERAPGIQKEIARLRRELDGLERTLRDNANVVAAQTSALAALRKFIPPHVEQRHARELASIAPLRVQLGEAGTALRNARSIIDFDLSRGIGLREKELMINTCRGLRPDLLKFTDSTIQASVSEHDWRKLVAETQEKLPGLESRVAELQNAVDSAVDAANVILDIYGGPSS